MRAFTTFILIVVLTAATAALTLVDGAVRMLLDPAEVIGAARQAGVRAALVDAAAHEIAREAGPQAHAIVDGILAADWFEGTLRRVHAAAVTTIERTPSSAVLDLRPVKKELIAAIEELHGRVEGACVRLAGREQCAGPSPARRRVEKAEAEASQALLLAADEIELGDGALEQERWREVLTYAPHARAIAAGVLGLLLLFIVLLNLAPLRRFLLATGLALLIAAAASLALHYDLERRAVPEELEKLFAEEIADDVARPVAVRLTIGWLDGAAGRARAPLVLAGLTGVVLLLGSALAVRSREP